jgi:cold shock CspA family protein
MRGIVLFSHRNDFCFIQTDDKIKYFCHISAMPMDEVGRRFLRPGEYVDFEKKDPVRSGRKTQAWKVRLVQPRDPINVETYYETGELNFIDDSGDWGYVTRPDDGSNLFFNIKQVREWLPESTRELYVGQLFEYRLINTGRYLMAFDAIEMVRGEDARRAGPDNGKFNRTRLSSIGAAIG